MTDGAHSTIHQCVRLQTDGRTVRFLVGATQRREPTYRERYKIKYTAVLQTVRRQMIGP